MEPMGSVYLPLCLARIVGLEQPPAQIRAQLYTLLGIIRVPRLVFAFDVPNAPFNSGFGHAVSKPFLNPNALKH